VQKIYNEPMDRLPPLNALRAFEAAARHLSITAAARELNVTPGAVSQLVRLLEQRLGVQLFRRLNRALALTEAGASYAAPIHQAFREIGAATRRLTSAGPVRLALSAPPAFAASWLVPRLGGFRAHHPEIDLRLVTSRALADFSRDGIDLAIRYGLGRYRGTRSDRVTGVALIPVCSPGFLSGLGARRPEGPADLARLPLLHGGSRTEWPAWLQAQGVDGISPDALDGPGFDDQMLLIQAAASGQGIALVIEALAQADLARGALVRVLDAAWRKETGYWLVCPRETADQKQIAAFRDWLLKEAAEESA
jgi:LysR family glycine cleavage system transcriptional activator